jgi:hypothetical protein
LRKELLVRFAHRLEEMHGLPYIVVTNPFIKDIYSMYHKVFKNVAAFPEINSIQEEQKFTAVLEGLVEETKGYVDRLAKGCLEGSRKAPNFQVDAFLESMIHGRISRRILAEQHIALHHATPGYVGIVALDCRPAKIAASVIKNASQICSIKYGAAPEVIVEGQLDATLPFVPGHLEYMLLELLKNAMRATIENYPNTPSKGLPPVRILICHGTSDVTLRISDQGGGLPEAIVPHLFTFGFTSVDHNGTASSDIHPSATAATAAAPSATVTPGMPASFSELAGAGGGGFFDAIATPVHERASPMAGFGFGLPMARLYARHFEGDLQIMSLPGYGVDAFLSLKAGTQQTYPVVEKRL